MLTQETRKKGIATKEEQLKKARKVGLLQEKHKVRRLQGVIVSALKKKNTSVIVSGLSKPTLITINPNEFDKLEIPDYQRELQPTLVNSMIRVLNAGGQIADPVSLVHRLYTTHNTKPGKLYIVDGQQRTMAHLDMQKPLQALVYKLDSYEKEKQLFIALNTKVTVSAKSIVNAWAGPSVDLLRELNQDESSSLFNRVAFDRSGHGTTTVNLSAQVLIQGMAISCGAGTRSNPVQAWLLIADEKFNKQRYTEYLELVARVFPAKTHNSIPQLVARAFGQVFFKNYPTMPSKMSIYRLSVLDWKQVTLGTWATRVMPLVLTEIEKRWKAEPGN